MSRADIISLSWQIHDSSLWPHKWTGLPTPTSKFWNFWQKKRPVKTGYLYFYWFLQTMTTFPERQCQETINVCEKEVQVLMSINCLVSQETAAWRNHWSLLWHGVNWVPYQSSKILLLTEQRRVPFQKARSGRHNRLFPPFLLTAFLPRIE